MKKQNHFEVVWRIDGIYDVSPLNAVREAIKFLSCDLNDYEYEVKNLDDQTACIVDMRYKEKKITEIPSTSIKKFTDLDIVEVAQISAVMSDTVLKPLYLLVSELGNGYMECISIIGGWAIEFHLITQKCSEWDDYQQMFPGFDCWDDLVMDWVGKKMEAYKKAVWMA